MSETTCTPPEVRRDSNGTETARKPATEGDRQIRLRVLEEHIKTEAEDFRISGLQIGEHLIEIRDNELWRCDQHKSWSEYLKTMGTQLVGISTSNSHALIQAAEVYRRVPPEVVRSTGQPLTVTALTELGRLAPNVGKSTGGTEKDFSKLRSADVARVLKTAAEISGNDTPSVKVIRAAVDADLGIDRVAKAKASRAESERLREQHSAQGEDLYSYLIHQTRDLREVVEKLSGISVDAWRHFEKELPGQIKEFRDAAKSVYDVIDPGFSGPVVDDPLPKSEPNKIAH